MSSDVEILLELPDKYLRTEGRSGGGMMMAGGGRRASTAIGRSRRSTPAAWPAAAW